VRKLTIRHAGSTGCRFGEERLIGPLSLMGQPKRLEEVLSAVLHRRKERAERRSAHIAELRKRATEAEAKLKRLYDAIENGIADVSDPMLKDHVTELKAIRDQSRADAERAEGALDRLGPSITPQALKTFASQARRRMRTEEGGYRRDQLRALAQRVEVDAKEIRIIGSKRVLLRTLVAASSAKTASLGVPSLYRSGAPEETATAQRNQQLSEKLSHVCLSYVLPLSSAMAF
jgi:site-specific DNA recombinase